MEQHYISFSGEAVAETNLSGGFINLSASPLWATQYSHTLMPDTYDGALEYWWIHDNCVVQQDLRLIDWTCTVRSTNLSKASSTWRRLASSRSGHEDSCSVTTGPNHNKTEGLRVGGRGVGTYPVYMLFRIHLHQLEGPCSRWKWAISHRNLN